MPNPLLLTTLSLLTLATPAPSQDPTPTSSIDCPLPAPPPNNPPARKIRVSSGVMSSLKLGGQTPTYPDDAKAAGVQGTVVLQVHISATGSVEQLCALTGPPVLRQPAYDAVKTWTYKPFQLNGHPTAVDTTVNINFSLHP